MSISVLFAGGGTGGHVVPAVAVARALERVAPGSRVLFLGTGRPVEARVLGRAGMPRVALPSAPASSWLSYPRAALAQARAFVRAYLEARSFRPDVVLGLGGYGSLPGVLAGKALGARVALFEPNATPGRATTLLGRIAREVYVHFDEAARGTKASAVVTGTPLDESSHAAPDLTKAQARARLGLPDIGPCVLIVGGSQGARALNRWVLASLDERIARGEFGDEPVSVLHVSGSEDEAGLRDRYARAGISARVVPFLDGMGTAYRAADLAICRAGAATLAEVAVEGLPAIAVPYPRAALDHQRANARAFESRGGVKLLDEASLSPAAFEQVLALAEDRPVLAMQSALARAQARPGAAFAVAACLVALARISEWSETPVPADRSERTDEARGARVSIAVAPARAA